MDLHARCCPENNNSHALTTGMCIFHSDVRLCKLKDSGKFRIVKKVSCCTHTCFHTTDRPTALRLNYSPPPSLLSMSADMLQMRHGRAHSEGLPQSQDACPRLQGKGRTEKTTARRETAGIEFPQLGSENRCAAASRVQGQQGKASSTEEDTNSRRNYFKVTNLVTPAAQSAA